MGYELGREELQKGAKGRTYLVINEVEAKIIRDVYRMYLEEGMNVFNVAINLNSKSVLTSTTMRTGTPSIWTGSRIQSILRNPLYKGQFVFYRRQNRNNREVVVGDVPALVDEDTWEAVQRRLEYNLKASPRNMKRFYLLRALIKCGLCGKTCIGQGRLKKNRSYYVCGSYIRNETGARCRGVRVRGEVLEELVWEDIKGFARNPGKVVELLAEKIQKDQQGTSGTRQELAGLEEEIREIERRRKWVIDHASRGLIGDEEAEHTLIETQGELQVIQARQKALLGDLELADMQQTQVGQTKALLAALADKVENADNQTKRTMVEALVKEIVIAPGENGGVKSNVVYRFGEQEEHITSSTSRR